MPIDIRTLKNVPSHLESQLLIHEYRESQAELKRLEQTYEEQLDWIKKTYDKTGEIIASQYWMIFEMIDRLKAERDAYRQALEKYGDMIVIDSEDRPHDVGMLAREALSTKWSK